MKTCDFFSKPTILCCCLGMKNRFDTYLLINVSMLAEFALTIPSLTLKNPTQRGSNLFFYQNMGEWGITCLPPDPTALF